MSAIARHPLDAAAHVDVPPASASLTPVSPPVCPASLPPSVGPSPSGSGCAGSLGDAPRSLGVMSFDCVAGALSGLHAATRAMAETSANRCTMPSRNARAVPLIHRARPNPLYASRLRDVVIAFPSRAPAPAARLRAIQRGLCCRRGPGRFANLSLSAVGSFVRCRNSQQSRSDWGCRRKKEKQSCRAAAFVRIRRRIVELAVEPSRTSGSCEHHSSLVESPQ